MATLHEFFNEEDVLTKWVTHADYKALEELRASDRLCLTDAVELLQGENYVLKRDLAELTAELAECRRDAERYRWLRDPNSSVGLVIDKQTGEATYDEGTHTGGFGIFEYRAGEELDKSIDNAIARTKA